MTSVNAVTVTGNEVELSKAMLDGLRAGLRGQLLTPADAAYDEARRVWNAMIDRRPGLILRCLGVADVVASVNFAREHGLLLSIKAGGHNISGLAVCDGGLTLDLSLMRGVWVDAPERVAHAQAGCLLGDVDRETQLNGLAAVLGFVSMTGVAGLTLGGGFGYLSKRFGWTSDTVRSMQVVTADGRVVRASTAENADLFWGLRGGGGNFGVVTDIELALFPVGPEIVGGAIAWPGEDAPAVLERFRELTRDAPPELACVAALRIAPPAPWIAKEWHGKPIVALFVCHTGPIAEAEALLAPLHTFGKPIGDIVECRSYVSQQALLDATQPKGRRYYWKSEYLAGVGPELFERMQAQAVKIPSPHSAVMLFPLGGAIGKLPAAHSAVGNRDAAWVVNIASSWESPEHDGVNMEWARAGWRDLRRFSTGGTYVNFLTEEEGADRIAAAYGENHTRLSEIKRAWDPGNLFRVNKNISPKATP
ncbi:MAG: FAD-binding oxidoreductase [Candidatus Eisenbacteria bacterium]